MKNYKIISVIALFFTTSLAVQLSAYVNHDVAYVTDIASRILSGDKLYQDILEINAPFLYYFRIIPVAISKLTGLSLPHSLILSDNALAIFSLILCWQVLEKTLTKKQETTRSTIFTAIAFTYFLLPFCLSFNEFGQTSHLATMFFMPWILLSTTIGERKKSVSKQQQIIIGTMAALGICLKPLYVIPFIAIELFNAYKTKNLMVWKRPDAMVIITVGIIYIAFIAAITPDYLTTTPSLIKNIYVYFGSLDLETLLIKLFNASFIYILPLVVLAPFYKVNDKLNQTLIIAILGFAFIAIIQMKGFAYHALIFNSLCAVLAAKLAVEFFTSKHSKDKFSAKFITAYAISLTLFLIVADEYIITHRLLVNTFALIIVIYVILFLTNKKYIINNFVRYQKLMLNIALLAIVYALAIGLYRHNTNQRTENVYNVKTTLPTLQKYGAQGHIMFFTEELITQYPASIYTTLEKNSAHNSNSLWMLKAIRNQYDSGHDTTELEQTFFRYLNQDLKNTKPDFIFYDKLTPDVKKMHVRDFLKTNAEFDKMWQDYALVESVKDNSNKEYIDIYKLQKKSPLP